MSGNLLPGVITVRTTTRHNDMKSAFFSLLILLSGITGIAAKGECAQDLQTHCSNAAKVGGRALTICIVAAEAKFSDPCLMRLARERSEVASIRQACKADETKLCADAKNGTDILMCIRTKDNDVSNRCRRVIESTSVNIW